MEVDATEPIGWCALSGDGRGHSLSVRRASALELRCATLVATIPLLTNSRQGNVH
jgi:hypothetical protein